MANFESIILILVLIIVFALTLSVLAFFVTIFLEIIFSYIRGRKEFKLRKKEPEKLFNFTPKF